MPSAKVLEEKKVKVAALKERIDAAVAGVVVDYKGITVEDDTKLRKELREAGVKYTVVSVDANALKNCRKLKRVTIGENVTAIGNNVFQNCKALTAVTIPAAVRSIGKSAFQGCSKLKKITFNTTKLTSSRVGANAFKGTAKKAVVKVPKSKVKTYKKLLLARGLHKTAIVE